MNSLHIKGPAGHAIDSELRYQQAMIAAADRPDMVPQLSAGEAILAMEKCLDDAKRAWYSGSAPHEAAGEHVRKITALGINFLSQHSAPPREGFE